MSSFRSASVTQEDISPFTVHWFVHVMILWILQKNLFVGVICASTAIPRWMRWLFDSKIRRTFFARPYVPQDGINSDKLFYHSAVLRISFARNYNQNPWTMNEFIITPQVFSCGFKPLLDFCRIFSQSSPSKLHDSGTQTFSNSFVVRSVLCGIFSLHVR